MLKDSEINENLRILGPEIILLYKAKIWDFYFLSDSYRATCILQCWE